jgi:hypothetical protein
VHEEALRMWRMTGARTGDRAMRVVILSPREIYHALVAKGLAPVRQRDDAHARALPLHLMS